MGEHFIEANGLNHFVRDSGGKNDPVAILLHGFPDSSLVWATTTPFLTAAGFRVIAPDLRGFGQTDMAPQVSDYDISVGALPDVIAIMDQLKISTAHIVGHDFGAPVAWMAAAQYPERFSTLTAISVGHVRAFLNAGAEQKWRSFYILCHQFRGVCEWLYRFNNWALFRSHWTSNGDIEQAITDLSRPGRLTAGLNWYRANMPVSRMVSPPPSGAFGEERVKIPTMGIWSDGEKYLTEAQMIDSDAYVDAPWRYERITDSSHWVSLDAPETLASLLIDHWKAAH